jgi:hypothetical protein
MKQVAAYQESPAGAHKKVAEEREYCSNKIERVVMGSPLMRT